MNDKQFLYLLDNIDKVDIDENLSRLIVEQLIMEFYNTNLDTFINSSLEIEYLEDKLEPLLYYKVNEYINGLKNNKKI